MMDAMGWITRFGRRMLMLLRRERFDADLEEEMRLHQELREQEQVERGVSPEEAHYAAQRRFGNKLVLREESRDMWGWNWFETLLQDVRYGLRQLRRNPGFTSIAILTLALGIGANTAIFSLIDAALLHSLPVRDPQNLVVFKWTARHEPKLEGSNSFMGCPGNEPGAHGCSFSYPMFQQLRSLTNVFSGMAAVGGRTQLTMKGNGAASNVKGELVAGGFFKTLGVHAAIGRALEPSDDVPGATAAAALSYGYWQRAFGGDPNVIGKVVELNGVAITIVGVIGKTFPGLRPGSSQEIWLPLSLQPELVGPNEWFGSQSGKKPSLRAGDAVWWVYLIARLKPEVSLRQAQAVAELAFRDDVLHGSRTIFEHGAAPRLVLMPAPEGLVGAKEGLRQPLLILMFAVGIVLLIACANIAGLTLARSAIRQKEIAVRLALGAGRGRLVRQLINESILLATAGGALGLLAAYWLSRSLTVFMAHAGFWPSLFVVQLDIRVLGFTAVISIATGVVFGLAPAFRITRIDLTPTLKENTGGLAAFMRRGNGQINLGSTVVAAQVALSVLVLAGAGLLVRTLENLKSINPGFDAQNVLLFSVDPTLQGYSDSQCRSFFARLQSSISGLPGVISASYSYSELLGGDLWTSSVSIEGSARRREGMTDALAVGPKFVETMGIPLLAGRTLSAADFEADLSSQPAIINEAFARQFFGHSNPLGRIITGLGKSGTKSEVVGVVGNAKYQALRKAVEPTVYVPQEGGSAYFEVRTARDPRALVPAVRTTVGRLNSDIPVFGVQTEHELIENSLFRPRLITRLSSVFATLALALACIGLYGLLSYQVVEHAREIGIRIALGAQKSDVFRLVIGQGLKLVFIGLAFGVAGALAITRFLSSLLYGVKPSDPLTFIVVSLILVAVAITACYIPARRAAKVDPIVTLRCE